MSTLAGREVPSRIVVNTRVLCAPVTGTQRYARELLSRWNGQADTISPRTAARGWAGHAWEQWILPARVGSRLLFSPSNTGPLLEEDQVVTMHDMAVFDCPETFSSRFVAWCRYLLPRLARRTRKIITVSEFVRERIVKHTGVCGGKIAVIPNGVGSQFCPEAVAELDRAVKALELPTRNYVIAVGSMELRKNLARLLEAWARAREKVSEDLWLFLVGAEGNSRVFAGVQFDRLPQRVLRLGHVEESLLAPLLAGARFLAYVSYYEGFGLPPLEAMASGTPVLAGNRSSLPEVVGDAGVLVDPFEVDDIAEAICGLDGNPGLRADLRSRGLLRARRFSWNETARRTWDLLLASSQADGRRD